MTTTNKSIFVLAMYKSWRIVIPGNQIALLISQIYDTNFQIAVQHFVVELTNPARQTCVWLYREI